MGTAGVDRAGSSTRKACLSGLPRRSAAAETAEELSQGVETITKSL